MRANTRRENRLAFDAVADAYDAARPTFQTEVVQAIASIAGLDSNSRVLEIGAGSGQLTQPLVAAGLTVTAMEPGERLRARLVDHFPSDASIEIVGGYFADYELGGERFDAIFAANSFHWLDPTTVYTQSTELLGPSGHLCLLWNFPMARRDVQIHLNESAFSGHPDQVRDPDGFLPAVEESLLDGRAELEASGAFDNPWWQMRTEELQLTPSQFSQLMISYASTAALSAQSHRALEQAIADDLEALGLAHVPLANHIYVCVAKVRT